ncbi:hypothetical protein P9112_008310 [Eukaryota sp. TZLM1-RC]
MQSPASSAISTPINDSLQYLANNDLFITFFCTDHQTKTITELLVSAKKAKHLLQQCNNMSITNRRVSFFYPSKFIMSLFCQFLNTGSVDLSSCSLNDIRVHLLSAIAYYELRCLFVICVQYFFLHQEFSDQDFRNFAHSLSQKRCSTCLIYFADIIKNFDKIRGFKENCLRTLWEYTPTIIPNNNPNITYSHISTVLSSIVMEMNKCVEVYPISFTGLLYGHNEQQLKAISKVIQAIEFNRLRTNGCFLTEVIATVSSCCKKKPQFASRFLEILAI